MDGKIVAIVILVILLLGILYKLGQKPEVVRECPPQVPCPRQRNHVPSSATSILKDVEDETQEEHFVWGPRRWFCPCGRWGRRRCPCRYRDYGYWM